ncbi:phenoloxidase-activating factor 2-like [Drosophila elegans]|uniref:phenoloxidase-activating factor 2-like n=1 Tax=Drosophila elegans TaxID=30023 RepID=UPI0007E61FD0|nr:phenoloxidase-activating factor 2-like [Drosophila elegans]
MFTLDWTNLRLLAIGFFLLSCILYCDACGTPFNCVAETICLKEAPERDWLFNSAPCKVGESCCEIFALPAHPKTEEHSQPGEYPWTVALFSNGKYFGGGSLISPGVVLTVAHLLRSISAADVLVKAGEWDLASNSERFSAEQRGVAQIVQHEDFVLTTGANNIALLYLKSPFELKEHIQTICLPPQGKFFEQKRCFVAGWGKQTIEDTQYSHVQKKIDLPMVDRAECQDQLRKVDPGPNFVLAPSLICAGGEKDRDACTGDGGSALFCSLGDFADRYEQAGIVSWGVGCGIENVPATFTNVALFRDWIDRSLARNDVERLMNCDNVGVRIG